MKLSKFDKYAIYVIIIASLLRLFITFFVHVSGDANWHVNVARFIARNLALPLFEPTGRDIFWAPPLFHILMALVYNPLSVFGDKLAVLGAQLITPLMASVTLIFNYLIVKKLYNDKIGFYATLFLAFLPSHIYFSTIAYVDIALMMFMLGAVHFALERKYILSAIFTVMSLFTKYNGLLIIPLVLYIIYLNEKKNIKPYIKYAAITASLGSIWFIRNWILLGNPIWPFLNNVFHGYQSLQSSLLTPSVGNFFSLTPFTLFIGDMIGIPAGNWANLFFFNMPAIKIAVALWLAGILIFFIPIALQLKKLKGNLLLFLVWVIPLFLFTMLYIYNASSLFFRFFFPALPIICAAWAFGFIRLQKINYKLINTLFILIFIGFAAVEFGKAYMASSMWKDYEPDFKWVKENTPADSVFIGEDSSSTGFNLDRTSYYYGDANLSKADYIWQQNNNKDIADILDKNRDFRLLYSNNHTSVEVYGRK